MLEGVCERRVAHTLVLRYYLERVASHELRAFWSAEPAVQLMTDEELLDTCLGSLEPSIREGVIEALAVHEVGSVRLSLSHLRGPSATTDTRAITHACIP